MMCDKRTVEKMIKGATKDLEDAKDRMNRTPRPASPCSAHDALFDLTRAQTDGILALLAVAEARCEEVAGIRGNEPASIRLIRLLTPWRWPLALICFSPFAGDVLTKIILTIKGG